MPSSGGALFKAWGEDECPKAHETLLNIIPATATTTDSSVLRTGLLPTLTAIGVNIPATAETVNSIGPWLKKYGISGSSSIVSKGANCSFAAMTYNNAMVRYISSSA